MQQPVLRALPALKENDKDYDLIERQILIFFKREIYLPLMKVLDLPQGVNFENSMDNLLKAILKGQIQYNKGQFSGKFNARLSKELKELGAKWSYAKSSFVMPSKEVPAEIKYAASASAWRFDQKLKEIDQHLENILPEEISRRFSVAKIFDKTLWKVDKEFRGSIKSLAVQPEISKETRERIASEWQDNLKLHIKDFTQKEIVSLRKKVKLAVFSGNRNDALKSLIQKSYGVSANKAKFLARQETRLLLTKYKQTRYEDAGVEEYRWGISNNPIQPFGAPHIRGQVRHDHGVLKGKVFRWSDPPITDSRTGARNNPGQDYNCRCYAIPLVRFKK